MEILKYTEAHLNFRKRLRRFLAKEVTPHANQWEKNGIVPKGAWQKMGQAGFLCTEVASEYGGPGGDFLYAVIVTEEISRTYQNGLVASLHSDVVVPYISAYASDDIKKKYLPGCVSGDIVTAIAMTEPDAGSDLAGISTSAVEEGDAVILNGSKTFISNGIIADLVVVAARSSRKNGVVESGHRRTVFLQMPHTQNESPGQKGRRIFDAYGKTAAGTPDLCHLGGCSSRADIGMDHGALPKHPRIGKTHCQIPGSPVRFGGNGDRGKTGSNLCRQIN
jgi:alkylation response protein AidB-like acyl-CoA dehydrogenase